MSVPPERILAVKLADIGDLLLITPALRALRQAFPAATLDALVTPRSAAAFQRLPTIDNLILFDKYPFDHPLQALRFGRWRELASFAGDLRRRRYDMVILFHHLSLRFGALKHAALVLTTGARRRIGLSPNNWRGWFLTHRVPDLGFGAKHELDYWLDLAAVAGAQADSRQVEMVVTEKDAAHAETWLPAVDRPTVAIHPGSGGYGLARRWDLAKFSQLGIRLRHEWDARLVVVGSREDGTDDLAAALDNDVINLGDRTTLAQLAAVLARCDLLVGADSGVLHLASAVGTPTVALFGPTNHRAWAPALPPDRLIVVRSGIACSPCAYTREGLGTPAGCAERTCMALISVEQVYEAAGTLLSRGKEAN
jgi:heptosyltransferase-2